MEQEGVSLTPMGERLFEFADRMRRTMRERLEIENMGFRRAFESDELREGTAAFLEKRRPAFAPPG